MRPDRRSAREILTWTACALAAGLVFFSPFPAGSHDQQGWSLAAALAILLGALALVARGLEDAPRARLDPALAALGCLAGIVLLQLAPLPAGLVGVVSPARLALAREAAAAADADPPAWLPLTACLKCTRDNLLLLIAYCSVFYAASTLLAGDRRWKLVAGAAVAGAAVLAVCGFAQVLAKWGTRLAPTFNANRTAAFMAMGGACAVGLLVAERGERGREAPAAGFRFPPGTIWIAALAVIETALVLTLSRLGIASAAVAALLTLAVFAGRRPGRRLTGGAVWAALACALAILAANAALAIDPVLSRYSVLFEGDILGNGRAQCWRMALPMVADYPALGSGAGTFKHVFRIYQEPSLTGWYTFAHNDYLNLLADAGLPGLAAGVAAIVMVLRRIVPLRASPDAATRGLAVAGVLGPSAVLLHSAADFPLQEPAVALAFFALAGLTYGRGAAHPEDAGAERPRPSRWARAAYFAAALVLCAATLPVLVRLHLAGRLDAAAGRIAVGRDEDVERSALLRRVDLFDRAARLDAWDAVARYESARTRVRLIADGALGEGTDDAVRSALGSLREGRRSSPLDPRPYYLEAVLVGSPEDAARSDALMRFAVRLAPASPDVAYQVGSYFLHRWLHARRAGGEFPLVRWQRSRAVDDELLARLNASLSLAARSPVARHRAVALALDSGLSSGETDAVLSPDAGIDLALAAGLAARGRHAEACARYERAFASDSPAPAGSATRVAYARSLLEAGRIEDAVGQFDEALAASEPGRLGETVRALGLLPVRPADAGLIANHWAALADRLGDETVLLLALGRAEVLAGRNSPGFRHLVEYAGKTSDVGAIAEIARLAFRLGRLELAASLAAEAARLQPEAAGHRVLQADALTRLGRGGEAAAALEEARLIDPTNAGVVRRLAALRMKAGEYHGAISAWNRFIEAGGDAAAGREALADIYVELLDRDRAAEELRRALEARPGDERLRKKLDEVAR